MAEKTRVLFLIPSLVAHGAERQLCELVKHMDQAKFDVHVAVFYDPGSYEGGELRSEIVSLPNVQLTYLHKRRGLAGFLTALPRLLALAFRIKPHLIHGYLDGNLPALFVGRLFRKPVVWGIRSSGCDITKASVFVRRLTALTARVSRHVDLIIFNSAAGRQQHEAIGIKGRRAMVIHNGFDVHRFTPNPIDGLTQRQSWGVPLDVPLIGIVGRFSPVKDHPTFLRAAARIHQQWPEARFVCVGGGPEPYVEKLKALARSLGIADRVIWTGVSTHMTAVYNSFSLLVLTSTDEGCPNAIGEAMACGIPCVSTKVGDAATLIGETGFLAEVGDEESIADAVGRFLKESAESRIARSLTARSRIATEFSVQALARTTERTLLGLLPDVHHSYLPVEES